MVVVGVPLISNTVGTYFVNVWSNRIHNAANEWVAEVPGAQVQGVEFSSNEFQVEIQTPDEVPPVDELMTDLEGQVPDGFEIVVTTSLGAADRGRSHRGLRRPLLLPPSVRRPSQSLDQTTEHLRALDPAQVMAGEVDHCVRRTRKLIEQAEGRSVAHRGVLPAR